MALNRASLESGIVEVCTAPADSAGGCAQQWAEAMGEYAAAVVPASPAVAGAVAALAGSLAGAFASPAAAAGMEQAFATFAATVGAGMAGFVPTPPPTPVGFASQFAQPPPLTGSAAASSMANLIDAWFRKGTATPVAGGAPISWS